mgnify:CR=1 FL=1
MQNGLAHRAGLFFVTQEGAGMTTETVQAPKIEFPCTDYPIKVIGTAAGDFADMVFEVVSRHAPDITRESLVIRDSRGGRYLSVQVSILATGPEQLQAIHLDLRATGRVQMVL